jgi:predicted dehydrogenase
MSSIQQTQPIRTALIGLGIAGSGFHTPLIRSLPALFTLSYVVDVISSPLRPSKLGDSAFTARFGANAKFTSEYDQILADQGIELVSVLCLTGCHLPFSRPAGWSPVDPINTLHRS